MIFEDFSSAWSAMIWSTFALAVVMGAIVNKTNFCTMGAVSDWVNMDDKGRMRSWLFAIAVALLGVTILESLGLANTDNAFPPYRSGNLIWAENILGGFLFGIGMTFGSGCGNKTLIRLGGGNLKSIMVFLPHWCNRVFYGQSTARQRPDTYVVTFPRLDQTVSQSHLRVAIRILGHC